MTCRPGHPARHPDFEPGNTVALRHGARSPRVLRAVAEDVAPELEDFIVEHLPWAAADRFALARDNLADRTALRLVAVHAVLDASGRGEEVPTRRIEAALSALRAEMEGLEALGGTPRSEAEIRATAGTAASIEANLRKLGAEGKAAIARRRTEGR